MTALNAVVSTRRSWVLPRLGSLVCLSMACGVGMARTDYLTMSTSVAFALNLYVMTCRFLGPGEFGRDRKERLSALPEMK